jgi:hypothetical protein
MPSQHRKHRGYASQRIVADWFREHGWPYAEPVGAGRDGSDITGLLDIDVEVKARRGFNPKAAMDQQAERSDARLAFAVLRLDGQGPASIGAWPVVLRLDAFTELLRQAGYGGGSNSQSADRETNKLPVGYDPHASDNRP